MELGRYGLWVGRALEPRDYGQAAALAEELGFGTLWLGSSPRLESLRPMLEASREIVIATGIVNVWQYEPEVLAREFADLEEAHPGRLLVGIGIGHREATQEYQQPLAKMRAFLDGVAAASTPIPRERMVLAALGPRMLELSAQRTLGTHPYFTPPAHTRMAREHLGSRALIAPEQAVVLDDGDHQAALASAREYAAFYLRLSNYANNLRRLGYTDQDLADGGSAKLVGELVPQGPPTVLAAAARAHLDAGADHVCVQVVGATGVPELAWRALAAELPVTSA
jgi:probable F420-dependent oxidoreductase